jgi:hypothetical protein
MRTNRMMIVGTWRQLGVTQLTYKLEMYNLTAKFN